MNTTIEINGEALAGEIKATVPNLRQNESNCLVINVGRVAVFIKAENDPPIGAHGDAPKPGQVARQWVQMEAG